METDYPYISDELLNRLIKDNPNTLPTTPLSDFELGKLIGKQELITKFQVEHDSQRDSTEEE